MHRILILGYGVQGKKRYIHDFNNIVCIVDPYHKKADFKSIYEVPLDTFDIAYICMPDEGKEKIIKYLTVNKKHLLIEKPFYPLTIQSFLEIDKISRKNKTVIYVAYNHRFEPNLLEVKKYLEKGSIGKIYHISFFYGNGTALNIINNKWKNYSKTGVFQDLGSHIFDLINFLILSTMLKTLKLI